MEVEVAFQYQEEEGVEVHLCREVEEEDHFWYLGVVEEQADLPNTCQGVVVVVEGLFQYLGEVVVVVVVADHPHSCQGVVVVEEYFQYLRVVEGEGVVVDHHCQEVEEGVMVQLI